MMQRSARSTKEIGGDGAGDVDVDGCGWMGRWGPGPAGRLSERVTEGPKLINRGWTRQRQGSGKWERGNCGQEP
jgi:hypothetical protein